MVKDVLRMNYFNGLFLKETEFNLEQDYHIRMRRIHNRRFFSPGIVWGLEVEEKDDSTIRIREGMALNEVQDSNLEKISQEIINADDDYEIDFSTETDFQEPPGTALAAGEVWICINYLEEEDGPSQSYGEVTHRIYKKETAQIQASNTPPENPPDEKKFIILGKVTIDVNKTITNIDLNPSFRENAGPRTALASAESFDTKKLTLSIEGATGTFASIEGNKFTLPVGSKNGIQVNSPFTSFSGPLRVQGNLEIVSGLLTIDGNDINTVVSTGWVRLPFTPMRYLEKTEFKNYIWHSICDSEHAEGTLAIPVPLNATRITGFRIAGEYIHGTIEFILYRSRHNGKDQLLNGTLEASSSYFDETFPNSDFKFLVDTLLDRENHTLALYVESTGKSDIYFVAALFE